MQVATQKANKTQLPMDVVTEFIGQCQFSQDGENDMAIAETIASVEYASMDDLISICEGYAETAKFRKDTVKAGKEARNNPFFAAYFVGANIIDVTETPAETIPQVISTESELEAMKYNELRAYVKTLGFPAGKAPKKDEMIEFAKKAIKPVAEQKKERKSRKTAEQVYVNLSTIAVGQQFKYPTGNAVHTLVGKGKDTNTIIALRNGAKEWHRDLDINDDIVIALGFVEVERKTK